jgi:hypothetical protein
MVDCFQDARWSVTDFGLEAVTPDQETCRIPVSRLLEIDGESFVPLYVYPMRVSALVGVDIEAFLDAWQKAIDVHGHLLPRIDQRILAETSHQARWRAEGLKRDRRDEANFAWADLPPEVAPSYPSAEAPSLPSMEAPENPAMDGPKIRKRR